MGITLNPPGGELPPPDTGAAGSENSNSDGAAGKNRRKSEAKSDTKADESKPAAKKTAAKKSTTR